MERVMDLTALDYALATPTGTVFTGVGQHDALPQCSGQDGLSFLDSKGLAAGNDADFELLHVNISKNGCPLSLIAAFSASSVLHQFQKLIFAVPQNMTL
jgi:hypothetical protein